MVRAWAAGKCHGIEAGAVNTWADVEALQRRHGIKDTGVAVDQQFNTHEVCRVCAAHSELVGSGGPQPGRLIGWLPLMGTAKREWTDDKGASIPWRMSIVEPNAGNGLAGTAQLERLDFWSDYFADLLEALRDGAGGWQFTLSPGADTDDYRHHMNGEQRNESTGHWEKRNRHWPNHLRDCEKMQVAFAVSLGLLEPT
jgi:hypothetical protein